MTMVKSGLAGANRTGSKVAELAGLTLGAMMGREESMDWPMLG